MRVDGLKIGGIDTPYERHISGLEIALTNFHIKHLQIMLNHAYKQLFCDDTADPQNFRNHQPPPLFFKGISPLSGLEIHLEHRLCHNFYSSNQHKFYEYHT